MAVSPCWNPARAKSWSFQVGREKTGAVYIAWHHDRQDHELSSHHHRHSQLLPRALTMVPDNAASKASLLKWWSQFTHAQKSKKFPEYNQRASHPSPRSTPSPPHSLHTRAPPRLRQTTEGLPQTGQRAGVHRKHQRRPLRLGVHSRRRRKVVRLRPLSVPSHSLPPAVSISKKTVHLPPSSIQPHLRPPATEIEGTFRVNGSAKRMRDLQAAFETPPRVRTAFSSPLLPFTSLPSTENPSTGRPNTTPPTTSPASFVGTSLRCL